MLGKAKERRSRLVARASDATLSVVDDSLDDTMVDDRQPTQQRAERFLQLLDQVDLLGAIRNLSFARVGAITAGEGAQHT